MSDLQIALVAAGVILIALVVAFNWWQDRRARRRMQAHFPEGEHDPLLGAAGAPSVGRREPGMVAANEDAEEADPTCEAVIDVSFANPVPGPQLRDALQGLTQSVGKPVRVLVMRDSGSHTSQLRADESYGSLHLTVLLANRQGPLTDIGWSHLWSAAQRLAQSFDGTVEGPEQEAVLSQANQLDALCAEVDAQVVLGIKPAMSRPLDEVEPIVRETGFVMYGDQLAWMSDTGLPRFTLSLVPNAEQRIERLDLILDVPNCQIDEQAFSRMAGVGRDLASRLNAQLLDEQGNPVMPQADAAIDQQVLGMSQSLTRVGFVAGDTRTLRLFS
ncbi:hypothetical protein H0484_01720 [Pusillimonas sp. CC-YST705]|uniref:Cell division protein ZipA n=1 Tax=Mesopusillimonas faecipullorum TaxID=2755040 RepID=A0ABS8C8X2_9BURK|nr:cell division protein ZipA C-terminal FtsZ-binding domain-containing protein [Mesopusillimonas faecipullorum]MCB5362474.1 hypothetical protein [Mesopusillimonas faecipullorum]